MILEKQKQANVLELGQTSETIGMSLDLDSAQILMQMLSKNLYSDSIGSTIRECASNALDSHRRANVSDPIIVSFNRNDSNNYEFSVEDFGTGLDANDVKNIISKYGKSTKRNSNTELGMMGLGFKAPLAYSSSFYFTCRKDGVERKYMMYEGEDTNSIDLIYEKPTSERNGVKVIVPVKWIDKRDFEEKIKDQLAYFQNVFFNVDGIDNNFIIHRSETFQYSELSSNNALHICLDDVYYPLDFEKLGIDRIYIPVGLRFGLSDKLFPTPNRESLIYTKEAKEVILNKIKEFANYMTEKYNESITDSENIVTVLEYYTQTSKYVKLFNNLYDYNQLEKYATVLLKSPKFQGINHLELQNIEVRNFSYLMYNYEVVYRYANNRMFKNNEGSWSRKHRWDDDNKRHFLIKSPLAGNKKLYIKEQADLLGDSTVYFIKKTKSMKLFKDDDGLEGYYTILNLQAYPKSMWRDVIKDWQYIESLLLKDTVRVDDVQIPQSWLDNKKAERSAKIKNAKSKSAPKLEGDFTCKQATDLHRYTDGNNCKFVPSRYNIDDITTTYSETLFIYTSHDDSGKLDELYGNFGYYLEIKLITFSNREIKLVENSNIPNMISYSEFLKGNTVQFKQFVTGLKAYDFSRKYKYSFVNFGALEKISTNLYKDIKAISSYKSKIGINSLSRPLTELKEAAKLNNSYDEPINDTINKMEEFLEDNPYVDLLLNHISYYSRDNEKYTDALAQLFKCNNIEVNSDYVFLKDVVKTEVVED